MFSFQKIKHFHKKFCCTFLAHSVSVVARWMDCTEETKYSTRKHRVAFLQIFGSLCSAPFIGKLLKEHTSATEHFEAIVLFLSVRFPFLPLLTNWWRRTSNQFSSARQMFAALHTCFFPISYNTIKRLRVVFVVAAVESFFLHSFASFVCVRCRVRRICVYIQ